MRQIVIYLSVKMRYFTGNTLQVVVYLDRFEHIIEEDGKSTKSFLRQKS